MAAFAIWIAFFSHSTFDQKIFEKIAPHISASRTRFMLFITFFGNYLFLTPANLLLLAYFLIKKNRYWATKVATISLISLGLMSLLKSLFQRPRPVNPMVEDITNFSFPSGHAFMSIAFYGLLICLISVNIKNKWLQRMAIAILLLLILLISFSRIYLRVHYTTDIIAGLSMGIACFISCLWLTDNIQQRNNNKIQGL